MDILDLPVLWWIDVIIVILLVSEAWARRAQAWARPAIVVYLTTAVWYLGDYAYSVPASFSYFDDGVVDLAFVQVGAFLIACRLLIGLLASYYKVVSVDRAPTSATPTQAVSSLLRAVLVPWFALFVSGLWLADWEVLAIVWPPTADERIGMFGHSGIGGGWDFLKAAGGYMYLAVCSIFGLGFALTTGRVRMAFGLLIALTWPYFLFDRARNVMLALVMPGILSYALFVKAPVLRKTAILATLAAFIHVWFLYSGLTRGVEGGQQGNLELLISEIVSPAGYEGRNRHLGLDMFKELCYINTYLREGNYEISWGKRYLAEALNFVPRTIWPGKPTIGLDYAEVRGFGGADTASGMFATISTGLIGQGLVNFGPIFGVISSALLMSVWTIILASLWLRRRSIARAMLFVLGLALTFNMGRDITLLVLWPFVFAYFGVLIYERWFDKAAADDIATSHGVSHAQSKQLRK